MNTSPAVDTTKKQTITLSPGHSISSSELHLLGVDFIWDDMGKLFRIGSAPALSDETLICWREIFTYKSFGYSLGNRKSTGIMSISYPGPSGFLINIQPTYDGRYDTKPDMLQLLITTSMLERAGVSFPFTNISFSQNPIRMHVGAVETSQTSADAQKLADIYENMAPEMQAHFQKLTGLVRQKGRDILES